MTALSNLGRVLTSWYVLVLAIVGLGVAGGLLIFVFLFPGQPKIGVIHIPFTVIDQGPAYVIGEYLNHARRDDSIKAVVIRLSSPGGGAAASERLYNETRRLRDEKPVVVVMEDLVASGGYMMAMGANHTYATSSVLVGSVGVISSLGPLISPLPAEGVVTTGRYKLSGFSRRHWFDTMNQLGDAFAAMVVEERRGKLRISKEELMEARLYPGTEALRLGLVDEMGTDTDAFHKAADLAGISNYGLIDVNLEVQKRFAQELADVLEPLTREDESFLSELLRAPSPNTREEASQGDGWLPPNGPFDKLRTLRELASSGIMSATEEGPLPGFPLELDRPNIYYLYPGYGP